MFQGLAIALGISPIFGSGDSTDMGDPDYLFQDSQRVLFEDSIIFEFNN